MPEVLKPRGLAFMVPLLISLLFSSLVIGGDSAVYSATLFHLPVPHVHQVFSIFCGHSTQAVLSFCPSPSSYLIFARSTSANQTGRRASAGDQWLRRLEQEKPLSLTCIFTLLHNFGFAHSFLLSHSYFHRSQLPGSSSPHQGRHGVC